MPAAVSSTADSPSYITDSDPEEDPEEDDEDLEEDPADYPTDKDDDDEEEESSRDDADDKEEDDNDDDDDEEEEHLAPTDSIPPPAYCTTTRMSILDQTPLPFSSEAEIPSPPLLVSLPLPMSPPPLPASPTHPLGYRAAMIRLRAESPSTSHPLPLPPPIILPHTRASMAMMRAAAPSTYILAPGSGILPSETPPLGIPPLLHIPLPTSSPPLLLPSTDCRTDVPDRRGYACSRSPDMKLGRSSSALTARPTGGFRADYGFVDTLDAEIRCDPDREICYGITDI
ncbi:hypothetical protein Tco_1301519 [Tanacetum coccineum]